MAITNKGSKWETKNSLFLITAFFPVVNCFAFFHMSGRIKNRKWSLLGWLTLVINLALIVAVIIGNGLDNPNENPAYTFEGKSPYIYDYLTSEQQKEYELFDNDHTSYKDSEEYKQYQEDYEKYEEERKAWLSTPENIALSEKYEQWENTRDSITNGLSMAIPIFNIFVIVMAFIERPKYLRLLANQDNRMILQDRMAGNQSYIYQNSGSLPVAPQPAENRAQNIQQNFVPQSVNPNQAPQNVPVQTVDINTASEDALAGLQGLNIIDAKKAIQYREANGGFKSVDEFFSVINAKPHIIARLENQLTLSVYQPVPTQKPEHSTKRTLDL
ncbi:MAG: helix-hairpin-helix domain-containing protein [Eubacterium sp.]